MPVFHSSIHSCIVLIFFSEPARVMALFCRACTKAKFSLERVGLRPQAPRDETLRNITKRFSSIVPLSVMFMVYMFAN